MLDAVFKDGARKGLDIGENKSVFSIEQERIILDSFDCETPIGLLEKTMFIISKFGALRGQGCNGFQLSWIKELPKNNLSQRSFSFVLPEEKTNQRGLGARGAARVSIIPYSCIIENSIIALYLSKRPLDYDTTDLFLSPATESQAKNENYWYHDRKASVKIVTQFIQRAVKKLDLKATTGSGFSGHSIRATAVTQMAKQGLQDNDIIAITGHRTSSSLQPYKQNTDQLQISASMLKLPAPIERPALSIIEANSSTNPPNLITSNRPFKSPTINKIEIKK